MHSLRFPPYPVVQRNAGRDVPVLLPCLMPPSPERYWLGPRSHDRVGQEGDYAIDVGKRETICHRCGYEGDCT